MSKLNLARPIWWLEMRKSELAHWLSEGTINKPPDEATTKNAEYDEICEAIKILEKETKK